MIGKATWERLSAPPVPLIGNRPVLLDEDTIVRFIESGSVALYCVPVAAGRIAGPRRFLARIGSGQALFSTQLQQPDGMKLTFVPAEDSVIREAPLVAMWTEMVERGLPLGGLIDAWASLLMGFVEAPGRQDLASKVAADRELTLEEGETLASERGQMLWIRVEQGRLELFANPALELAGGEAGDVLGRVDDLRHRPRGGLGGGRQAHEGGGHAQGREQGEQSSAHGVPPEDPRSGVERIFRQSWWIGP